MAWTQAIQGGGGGGCCLCANFQRKKPVALRFPLRKVTSTLALPKMTVKPLCDLLRMWVILTRWRGQLHMMYDECTLNVWTLPSSLLCDLSYNRHLCGLIIEMTDAVLHLQLLILLTIWQRIGQMCTVLGTADLMKTIQPGVLIANIWWLKMQLMNL